MAPLGPLCSLQHTRPDQSIVEAGYPLCCSNVDDKTNAWLVDDEVHLNGMSDSDGGTPQVRLCGGKNKGWEGCTSMAGEVLEDGEDDGQLDEIPDLVHPDARHQMISHLLGNGLEHLEWDARYCIPSHQHFFTACLFLNIGCSTSCPFTDVEGRTVMVLADQPNGTHMDYVAQAMSDPLEDARQLGQSLHCRMDGKGSTLWTDCQVNHRRSEYTSPTLRYSFGHGQGLSLTLASPFEFTDMHYQRPRELHIVSNQKPIRRGCLPAVKYIGSQALNCSSISFTHLHCSLMNNVTNTLSSIADYVTFGPKTSYNNSRSATKHPVTTKRKETHEFCSGCIFLKLDELEALCAGSSVGSIVSTLFNGSDEE